MLTWPLHCQWHFRKGQSTLTHIHNTTTTKELHFVISHTCRRFSQIIRLGRNQVLELFSRASVWICLRFACIHAPDCLSSCFRFTTTICNHSHRLIVFWDTQPQVKQCALQDFESTACRFPSICPVSPFWLSGPAGIIDHPSSAHYHTEWRSHSSYETQDDPEQWISVLGLISCPNWPIVHQRGFCTFHCLLSTDENAQPVKNKSNCSMMHSQWPHPFPFFTRSEFYRARKWKDRRTQGSPCKYCHRDLESVTVLLQSW